MKHPLFDTREPHVVTFKSGGRRQAKMRFPTDKECIERQKSVKVVAVHSGDRTVFEPTVNEYQYDTYLFPLLTEPFKDENTDEFDAYEMGLAIGLLTWCIVTSSEETADGVKVTLEICTPGIKDDEQRMVSMQFKLPKHKQSVEFTRDSSKNAHVRRGAKISQETRHTSLEPTLKIWSELIISTEGYAEGSDIPVVHKNAAITEVFRLMGEE